MTQKTTWYAVDSKSLFQQPIERRVPFSRANENFAFRPRLLRPPVWPPFPRRRRLGKRKTTQESEDDGVRNEFGVPSPVNVSEC